MTAVLLIAAAVVAGLWLARQVYALRARIAEAGERRTRLRAERLFVGGRRGAGWGRRVVLAVAIWVPVIAMAARFLGKT